MELDPKDWLEKAGLHGSGNGAKPGSPGGVDKVGVFIAIPSLSGLLRWSIGTALAVAGRKTNDPSCPWSFAVAQCVGKYPVSEARNDLSKALLSNEECQWIWFWDDDQDVPPNFLDLLDHAHMAKILSGLVWMWKGEALPHLRLLCAHGNFNEKGELMASTEPLGTDPYFVDGAGTGFLLIHRSVIEEAGPNPFGVGMAALEDLHFCKKANAMGHRVLVVPSVNPNHVKNVPFNDLYGYSRGLLTYALGKLDRVVLASDPAGETDGAALVKDSSPIDAASRLTPSGVED